MKNNVLFYLLVVLIAPLSGCMGPTVKVAPIKVEPIHITMDINIKVDKGLDDFFDFEEEDSAPTPDSEKTPAPDSN